MSTPPQDSPMMILAQAALERPFPCRGDPLNTAQPASEAAPTEIAPALSGRRCRTRGCVFPARDVTTGLCRLHLLQDHEPKLFQSFQPILRVLLLARYNVTGLELEDYRAQQQIIRAEVREAFLRGVA